MAKNILEEMYKRQMDNDIMEDRMSRAYSQYLNSKPQNPYDNGQIWSLPRNYNESFDPSPYQRKGSSISDIFGLDEIYSSYGFAKPTPKFDYDIDEIDPLSSPRNQVDYYTNKLKEIGVEPNAPKEVEPNFDDMNLLDKALYGLGKILTPLDYMTKPLQAVGNTIAGTLESKGRMADENLKKIEGSTSIGELIKNSSEYFLDATINPLALGENVLDGLKSGGSTLAGLVTDKYKDNNVDFTSFWDTIYNSKSKTLGSVGGAIKEANPVSLISEHVFGVDEKKSEEYGKLALGLATDIALSPDLSDVSKGIKYLKNADKIDSTTDSIKSLKNMEEATNLAKSRVPIDVYKDEMAQLNTRLSGAELDIAYDKHIKILADDLINQNLKIEGAMPEFEGIGVDGLFGKTINGKNTNLISRETLSGIAQDNFKKNLTIAGLSMYSPLGAVLGSNTLGSITDKVSETKLGKDLKSKFIGGRSAEYIELAKNDKERSLEYLNLARGIEEKKNKYKFSIENTAKQIEGYLKENNSPNELTNFIEDVEIQKQIRNKTVEEKHLSEEFINEITNLTKEEILSKKHESFQNIKSLGEKLNELKKINDPAVDKLIKDYSAKIQEYEFLTSTGVTKTLNIKEALKGKIDDSDIEKIPTDFIGIATSKNTDEVVNALKELGVSNPKAIAPIVMKHSNDALNEIDSFMPNLSKHFKGVVNEDITPKASDFMMSEKGFESFKSKYYEVYGEEFGVNKRWLDKVDEKTEKGLLDNLYKDEQLQIKKAKELGISVEEYRKNEFEKLNISNKQENLEFTFNKLNVSTEKYNEIKTKFEEITGAKFKPNSRYDNELTIKEREDFFKKVKSIYNSDKNQKPLHEIITNELNKLDKADISIAKNKGIDVSVYRENKYNEKLSKLNKESLTKEQEKYLNTVLNSLDETKNISNDTPRLLEKAKQSISAVNKEYDFFNVKKAPKVEEKYNHVNGVNFPRELKSKIFDIHKKLGEYDKKLSNPNLNKLELAKFTKEIHEEIVDVIYDQVNTLKISVGDGFKELLLDTPLLPKVDSKGKIVKGNNDLISTFNMLNQKEIIRNKMHERAIKFSGKDESLYDVVMNNLEKRLNGEDNIQLDYSMNDVKFEKDVKYNQDDYAITHKGKKIESVMGTKANKNVSNNLTDEERATLTRAVNEWRGNNKILTEVSEFADNLIDKSDDMVKNHYSIKKDFDQRLANAREDIQGLTFEALRQGKDSNDLAEMVYNYLYKEGYNAWDNLLTSGKDKQFKTKHGKRTLETKFVSNNINFDTFKSRMGEVIKKYHNGEEVVKTFNSYLNGEISYDTFRVQAGKLFRNNKKKLEEVDSIYKSFSNNEISFEQFKDRFMTSYVLGNLADTNYSKIEAIMNTVDNELLKNTFRDIDNFYTRNPVTLNITMAKELLKQSKAKGLKIRNEEGFINSIVGSYPNEAFGYNGSVRKFIMNEINNDLRSVTNTEADILLIANRNRKLPDFSIPETIKTSLNKSEPFNSTSFMESNKYDDVLGQHSVEQDILEQNRKLSETYNSRTKENTYALAEDYEKELNPLDMEYSILQKKLQAMDKELQITDPSSEAFDVLSDEILSTYQKLDLTSEEITFEVANRIRNNKIEKEGLDLPKEQFYHSSKKPVLAQIKKAAKEGKKSLAWHFRNNGGFTEENMRLAIFDNKVKSMYRANELRKNLLIKNNPKISKEELLKLMKEQGIHTSDEMTEKLTQIDAVLSRMNRAELEISTHRILGKANDFNESPRLSNDEIAKFNKHKNTEYLRNFENNAGKYLEKLGLDIPVTAYNKTQKSTYYGLYNLFKNMTIIKKYEPKLYDQIKGATNNFALNKVDRHTVTYVSDMAFHLVNKNKGELGEISSTPLTKITGQSSININDINDVNLNSSKLVAVTKAMANDIDINQNPLFLFGANAVKEGVPSDIKTFLRFDTGKNTINVDINSKQLEGVNYNNLDGVNVFLTDELTLGAKGYYRTDGTKHDIFLKNKGSYDVANHEYSHYIANSLKIPTKDYKKFTDGIKEMLKGSSDEKLDEVVSLIRDINIDETSKEMLKDGFLTKNISMQPNKLNEENFATLGSLFLHNNASVRKRARELFGDDLYNGYMEYASKVKMTDINAPSHNRIDFNNILDDKLRRLSNIVEKNDIFAGTEEAVNVSNIKKELNDLQIKLNGINKVSSLEDIKAKDDYVLKLAEEFNMTKPSQMQKINENIQKYDTLLKEVDEIDVENLDFKNLSDKQKEIVLNFRESMAKMGHEEGLYNSIEEARERLNYVPHQFTPNVYSDKVVNEYVNLNKDSIRSPINNFSKERKIEGTIKQINDKAEKKIGQKIFEDNLYKIWINRQIKSSNYVYKKGMFDSLIETVEGVDSVNSLGTQVNKGFGFKAISIADAKLSPEVEGGMGLNNYYRALSERYGIEPIKKVSKDNPTKTYDDYIAGYYEHINKATANGYVIVKKDANIKGSTVANVVPDNYKMEDSINKGNISYQMQDLADKDIKAIQDFDPFEGYTVLNSSQIKEQEILSGDKGETFIIKKEAYEIYRKEMESAFKSDKSEFIKMYDKINGLFKAMAVTSGKFHFNNAIGNIFNSYMTSGANLLNPKTFVNATKIMRGLDVNIKGYNQQEILYIMHKFGLLDNSQLSAEFNMGALKEFVDGTTETISNGKAKTSMFNPLNNNFLLYGGNKKIGDTIENHAKISNFITHLESGMSEVKAVELTKKALFDYSDLTEFETKNIKRIIPFYTFLRKNVPLQIENLANNPFRYYLVDKYTNAFSSIGEDERERKLRPDYMKNDIALGNGKYLNLNLPMGDLDKINNPKDMLNMISPMIKTPLELALNQNIHTGAKISRTGNAKDYLEHTVKNILPVTKLAENTRGAIGGDENAMNRLLTMAGNPVRSFDMTKAEQSSMYDYVEVLKNQYYNELNNNPQLQNYIQETKGKNLERRRLEEQTKKKKALQRKYYEDLIRGDMYKRNTNKKR